MKRRDQAAALRVGFMADAIAGGGGMGRYVREVLHELGRRDDVELLVALAEEDRTVLDALAPGNLVGALTLGGRGQIGRGLWERYRLASGLARHRVEVVHGVKHVLPSRPPMASVLTVHDLMPITSPSQFTLMKRLLLPRQYRASLAEATMLVAVSATTARRLADLDPRLAAKTVVVPNGVAPTLLTLDPEPIAALARRRFALVVSDLSPRKNVALLCDIWDEVAATTGMLLVSVGPEGWRAGRTLERLERLVRRGLALRLERVPEAQLRWCYEHAEMVLLPTFEEGFGLPAIEALALGAPVVASTDEALREAGQGRAIHVDPQDRSGWIRAIRSVMDEGGPRRSRLSRLPSWMEHAQGLVDVYRTALARTGRFHSA